MKKTILIIIGFSIFLSCSKDSGTTPTPTPTPTPAGDSLPSIAPFKVGCSVNPDLLKNNAAYRATVLKEFNSITEENAMKWGSIHPSQNTYNYADADYIADFAVANNKRLFGHNLLWHAYNPTWLENFQGDSAAFESLLKSHIQTVVGHFKGKAVAWDVVNEAFSDGSGNLRTESIWYKKLGKDYIARAFQYANQADPSAVLIYNDYNQENDQNKLNAILAMVTDFKKRGIPIHGLGLQMHIGLNNSENGILNAISEYAKTGLKIHISELDISVNGQKDATLTFSTSIADKQKAKYQIVVGYYKSIVPTAQQFGITTWNVGDSDSWLRGFIIKNEYPLLFDDNYAKKPAYDGFVAGAKS